MNSVGRFTLWMHTLNGEPAQYCQGSQIVFAPRRVTRFARSLQQIHKERLASQQWRLKHGYTEQFRHGHISIRITPELLPKP